ncbi:MAG: HD domain-containing protein, partial [Candidatus Moranbacteria bacterium]|nr:HD domain-containing protein [Candidatus Moranbacteria bacterium]
MIAEKELQDLNSMFHQLKLICRDCSSDDLQNLDKAYNFAGDIYGDRRKPSGELMLMHGLSVAAIVADEIGLRSGSVIASLLHDITDYT